MTIQSRIFSRTGGRFSYPASFFVVQHAISTHLRAAPLGPGLAHAPAVKREGMLPFTLQTATRRLCKWCYHPPCYPFGGRLWITQQTCARTATAEGRRRPKAIGGMGVKLCRQGRQWTPEEAAKRQPRTAEHPLGVSQGKSAGPEQHRPPDFPATRV